MIRRLPGIAALAAVVAIPLAAQAQRVPGGIERGSREGERTAGPVAASSMASPAGVVAARFWSIRAPTGLSRSSSNARFHGVALRDGPDFWAPGPAGAWPI